MGAPEAQKKDAGHALQRKSTRAATAVDALKAPTNTMGAKGVAVGDCCAKFGRYTSPPGCVPSTLPDASAMPVLKLLRGKEMDVAGTSTPLAAENENWRISPDRVKKKKLPWLSMAGRFVASAPRAVTQAAGPSGASVSGWKPTTKEQVAFWAPITSCAVRLFQISRVPTAVVPHAAG